MKKRELAVRPYDDIFQMMNRFFGLDMPQMGGNMMRSLPDFKVDVKDQDENYLVEAELPGINKDEINIDLSDNYLTIEVQKQQQQQDQDNKEHKYVHRERSYASMKRSIYLNNVTRDGIKAKLDNGMLQITVPKSEPNSQKPKIEIE